MLYLIEGQLSETHYMESRRPERKVTRIVEAATWQEAEDKFIRHFEDQSRPYDVSYSVTVEETNEVIR